MMKKNSLIMFDCFGVISSLVLPPWFKRNFGEQKGKELEIYYCSRGDMGVMSLKDIANDVAIKYNKNSEDVFNEWIMSTKINEGVVSLIKELKKNNTVVLASNAAEGLVESVFTRHHLEDLFDYKFISWKMKKVKPNKGYYEAIINQFPTKFDSIYMIDDRKINLEQLEEIGVKGILFIDAETLRKELGEVL